MNDLILIDTDILIDVARGVEEAIVYLEGLQEVQRATVSIVTQMELMIGCRNKAEMRTTEQFLQRFEVISLNEQISTAAVELLRTYRLSHGLLIADALIAGTAKVYDIAFATKNQKDFRFITGLNLIRYLS